MAEIHPLVAGILKIDDTDACQPYVVWRKKPAYRIKKHLNKWINQDYHMNTYVYFWLK